MCITYTKVVWRIILVDAAVSWEENKDLIIGKITDSKDKNNNTRTFRVNKRFYFKKKKKKKKVGVKLLVDITS